MGGGTHRSGGVTPTCVTWRGGFNVRHTQQPAFLLGLLPLAQTLGAEQAISTAQHLNKVTEVYRT